MKNIYKKIGSYLILTIASICFLVPFYLMICKASGGNIALSKGVQVFGAERFAVGNTSPERAVRLSICTPETLEELEDGLKILSSMFSS